MMRVIGNSAKLFLLAFGLLSPSLCHAAGKTPPPQTVLEQQVDGMFAVNLARATLMSIHDANISGNYTVLKDLGSPAFQRRSAIVLATSFSPLRQRNLDLFMAASTVPRLSTAPVVDADGRLHVKGSFTTRPQAVLFDFTYEQSDGIWKHSSLRVGLSEQAADAAR